MGAEAPPQANQPQVVKVWLVLARGGSAGRWLGSGLGAWGLPGRGSGGFWVERGRVHGERGGLGLGWGAKAGC